MEKTSLLTRLLDLISPRLCLVCGQRLSVSEEVICSKCNLHLPRTDFHQNPSENIMAKLFWGQMAVERATALYFHEPQSESARIIYDLKYRNHPEIGEVMGRMMARELQPSGFFEGIDAIVPVPLARKRQRQRGYNQSLQLAQGISLVTHLPITNRVVRRTRFEGSQTSRGRWDRNENVEQVFQLTDGPAIAGKHLLIVDDVVTTGATIIACAKQLAKAGAVSFSVLTLAFAKS